MIFTEKGAGNIMKHISKLLTDKLRGGIDVIFLF